MEKYKVLFIKTNSGHCYRITLPKPIIQAFRWDENTHVTFEILGKDKLKIEKVKNTPIENTGEFYRDQEER